MDNQTLQPRMPWWRVKTMWLVIAGPAAVVVAGVLTAVVAVGGADPVVAPDLDGPDTPAVQARNHAAQARR